MFSRCSYLVDVLALKLRQELVQALLVGLDTDGLEDLLDVGGAGRGVAAQGEEEVSCEVLHFGGLVWLYVKVRKKKLHRWGPAPENFPQVVARAPQRSPTFVEVKNLRINRFNRVAGD